MPKLACKVVWMIQLGIWMAVSAGRVVAQAPDELESCMKKADTQFAMLRCASDELGRKKAEHQKILDELVKAARSDRGALAKVRAMERAWEIYRNAYIEAIYPNPDQPGSYGTMGPTNVNLNLAFITSQHIKELRVVLEEYGMRGDQK
jgi:uncharacterized protein YecT (DUF1311 family)